MAETDSSLDPGRRSPACPGTQLCMILLLFAAPTATRAQTPETFPPPSPEYKIEVVLFENLQASARNEDPGPIPAPPGPVDPADLNLQDSGSRPEESLMAGGSDQDGAEEQPPEAVEPVSLLFESADREDLAGIARALRRRPGYRVLAHESWIQAGFPRNSAPSVDLGTVGRLRLRKELADREDSNTSDWHATGTVWVGRYLHLDMDAGLDTGGRTVQMAESRRMRIGEMHYFDSPRIGAIAIIVRWEPNAVGDTTAHQDAVP